MSNFMCLTEIESATDVGTVSPLEQTNLCSPELTENALRPLCEFLITASIKESPTFGKPPLRRRNSCCAY